MMWYHPDGGGSTFDCVSSELTGEDPASQPGSPYSPPVADRRESRGECRQNATTSCGRSGR